MESRPWGMYEVLLDSPECKVKRITVAPGQRLSYQYHYKRKEIWTVVKGNLTIVLDHLLQILPIQLLLLLPFHLPKP